MKKIGNKLKALRINAKLSQAEVAKKLDLSPSSIGHFENDKREGDSDMLSKFAALYEVPIGIFYEEGKYHVSYVDKLLEQLTDEGIITGDLIDAASADLIINAVKMEIKYQQIRKAI